MLPIVDLHTIHTEKVSILKELDSKLESDFTGQEGGSFPEDLLCVSYCRVQHMLPQFILKHFCKIRVRHPFPLSPPALTKENKQSSERLNKFSKVRKLPHGDLGFKPRYI